MKASLKNIMTNILSLPGISDKERVERRKKNVVTTGKMMPQQIYQIYFFKNLAGFNLIVWMIQFLADILVSPMFAFLYPNFYTRMLLLSLVGCGFSPLAYLVGSNVITWSNTRKTI